MNRMLALLLMVGMVFSGASIASDSAQDFPIGFDDLSRTSSLLNISSSSPEFTSISLSSPMIRVDESVIGFETYQQFDVAGEPVYYREGYPAIPQITRYYRIPNTGSVELVVRASNYTVVEDVNSLPVQPEEARFEQVPVKAADVYGVDAWYPENIAMVGEPMIMRDFRIVPVTLFPVQVNPFTGQARVYDQLEVDLVSNSIPGVNEITRPRRISSAFAPAYSHFIANLDETALDDIDEVPGQYLILCNTNTTVLQWADTLKTWKQRRGFDVTIDSRGNWTANSMKTAVQTLYNTPDANLGFVCIIGDPQGGNFSMPTGSTDMDGHYDHYFGTVDGTDDIADVAVGRLSANSASMLALVVTKVMAYEREPYMDDTGWYDRAFLYAGTGSGISSNETMWYWAKRQFENLTGVNTVSVLTHAGNVNTTTINSQLNDGRSYFFWRGSVIGEMSTAAASGTSNGAKLPIVLTITCGTGNFDWEQSISESWLQAGTVSSLKGGVAAIGTATSYTHVSYNNTVSGGLIYSICNLGLEHLGVALAVGKAELFRAFPGDIGANHFSRWNNLMGEPALSMWTDQPIVMDCSFPGTINSGARRVTVQALDDESGDPIADALVVLWKGDESYTRGFTDAGGFVDMPVTANSPGDLLLTVTKRNHKPFLETISVVNSPMNATFESYTVDDDNSGGTVGNGDAHFNPGETIDLPVTLKNHGTSETAQSISVTMVSDNPKVTVLSGTVAYPSIPVGQTAVGASPFRIAIDPSMRHEETAKLTLAVSTSAGTIYSTVEITGSAGDAVFASYMITGGDGDYSLEPGETVDLRVTVRNEGGLNMQNVTGHLISRHNLYSVIDADADFSNIAVGDIGSNIASLFSIRANSAAYPGTLANLILVLTYGSGSVDSVAFSQPIGTAASTDPTGPDEYGYFAYDNIDTDFNNETFEWIYPYDYLNIATIGTRLAAASADPGEQQPGGQTNSNLVALPFTFRFYGEDYNNITVCSNGWAAFGDQSELDMFRNYQIPAPQTPDAMLAVFWDDLKTSGTNNGVFTHHDAVNDRFIIQWTAVGAFQNSNERFQILLLDPDAYPTDDGNGIVVFQYNEVHSLTGDWNDVEYETVGIQAPGGLVGLSYRFGNEGTSGAASLTSGRTITITTQANVATGNISGTVIDAATSLPLQNVEILIDDMGLLTHTNAAGTYEVTDQITGTYSLRARLHGYNDGVIQNFVVEMDSLEIGNFSMLHPEIELSVDQINVNFPENPPEASFTINNDGNGPLDYQISVSYSLNDHEAVMWETIQEHNLSDASGYIQIHGCELMGDYWYASATRNEINGSNKIFKFNQSGEVVNSFDQSWTPSGFGIQDLATDGNYIYGSGGPDIVGLDANGVVQTTITGVPEINPKSAIAYDPATDHFWVTDFGDIADIYEIGRDGHVYSQFDGPHKVKGLAWYPNDPDGYKLYTFHVTNALAGAHVSRMHPISGDVDYIMEIPTNTGERAAGCTITGDWNSALIVFAGVIRTSQSAYLEILPIEFRRDWFSVSPLISSVNPGSSRDISIFFEPEPLRNFSYDLNLYVNNNSLEDTVLLPIRLTVLQDAPETPIVKPVEYSLRQNYPNPFNSTTTFDFDLKQSGMTTLTIYNLLGQEVAQVVDGFREAGRHQVNFDMNSTASGVYLYRLQSGEFNQTKKLILLK